MGSEVKLNTKPGYKFRKVEVKKRPTTLTITDGNSFSTTLNIEGCTTWDQVITKNSNMIMKDDSGNINAKTDTYGLYKGESRYPVNVDDPFDPDATDYKWQVME